MTTTLGMFGTMVWDRAEKVEIDFYAAPVKRWYIAGSELSLGISLLIVTGTAIIFFAMACWNRSKKRG